MKIFVECFWQAGSKSSNAAPKKLFAFADCWRLVEDYTRRISDRGIATKVVAGELKRRPRSQLWLCHPRGKALSSVGVSEQLQRALTSGLDLVVAVGTDQGFSATDISKLKPDLIWSFGPITLPHELATVVAAEQLYRAVSILRHEPYHRE